MKSGTIFLDSWAGRTHARVRILKETPKYYHVVLLQDCIKGRAGTELKRVPKDAVHLIAEQLADLGPLFAAAQD